MEAEWQSGPGGADSRARKSPNSTELCHTVTWEIRISACSKEIKNNRASSFLLPSCCVLLMGNLEPTSEIQFNISVARTKYLTPPKLKEERYLLADNFRGFSKAETSWQNNMAEESCSIHASQGKKKLRGRARK